MLNIHRRLSFAAAVAMLALVLGFSASAQGQGKSMKIPYGSSFSICNLEPIETTGSLNIVAGERVGKDGCIKSTFHVNSQGVSGVGMVTGDEYRIIDITNQQTIDMIACDGCTAEADIVMMWKVIARNGETWTAQQVVTLKFDACTNEFTVTVKQSSVGCK